MPARSAGNTISRGSACLAVGEHDLQLAENHVPILAPGVPMLDDPLRCQVQHPPQRIVVGERRLVLGDLPELPVQTLNDIRRVYDCILRRRTATGAVTNGRCAVSAARIFQRLSGVNGKGQGRCLRTPLTPKIL